MALGYIPIITYLLWYSACRLSGVPFTIKSTWTKKSESISWPSPAELGIVTLGLIGILVNFSYNAFYQFFYNYHHLNFITGPLNDVLNGKILLVDTKAQYGFLNIFLSSWLFRTGWYFSHPNVHFLSMMMGVIEYAAVYLSLRILTKSKWISIWGIIMTTSLHFYGVLPTLFPSELFVWPGGSVWRFFPVMPTILLFVWWSKSKSLWAWRTLQLSVAISTLWNLESGIPLLLGYVAAHLAIAYLSPGSWTSRAKELLTKLLGVVWYLGLIVGGYSLYVYVQVTHWPDWSQYWYYAKLFNSGFLQFSEHAPTIGLLYWPILLYGVVILVVVSRKYFRRGLPLQVLPSLTMLAVYGYGIFRYYLGKQNPSDWAAVVIPAVIIMVYLCHFAWLSIRDKRYGKIVAVSAALILFTTPLFRFVRWGFKLEKHRYGDYLLMQNHPNSNYPAKNRLIAIENTAVPTIPITELMESAQMIQKYSPNKERVAIIGYFDHVLLMQAERVNLADYYYLHATLYTKQELAEVVELYRTVPEYLFVDKRVLRNAAEYRRTETIGENTLVEIFDQVRDKYEWVDEAPMLYVYRRLD